MQIRPEPASIGKIVNESVENLNNWAKTKSVAIQQKIQEALPDLSIDPNRIVQVMTNLIGNAIKFTPANGTITVEALLSPSGREVQVSVADTGIGIPKESLDKVFEKFYQVGERTSTDIGGTGIGLSIAKEIVQLHGGRIWAESEKGSGAKFTFTLPLQ